MRYTHRNIREQHRKGEIVGLQTIIEVYLVCVYNGYSCNITLRKELKNLSKNKSINQSNWKTLYLHSIQNVSILYPNNIRKYFHIS